jgi:uncharacterized metal-binding protein YceD (DUF177 family)
MAVLREFKIPFIGLKNGVHIFEYKINDAFFENFEDTFINDANIDIRLKFDKKEHFFELDFSIDGDVKVECDRCLGPLTQNIYNDFKIIVKFEDREGKIGDEENVIYLQHGDSHIEIADIIYDYILISVPMQMMHPNDKEGNTMCDPEIIKILTQSTVKTVEAEDPRWEVLKKIVDH